MAEHKDPSHSPAWKKPSDVMKVRLTKRRASSVENAQSLSAKAPPSRGRVVSSGDNGDSRSGKRRNPFGQEGEPPARRRASQNNGEEDREERRMGCHRDGSHPTEDGTGGAGDEGGLGGVTLFQALDSGDDKVVFEAEPDKRDAHTEEYHQELRGQTSEQVGRLDAEVSAETGRQPDTHTSVFLPLDWSIKSRLRFTSPHPFSWSAPLKTTEEAQGLCSFVKCEDLSGVQDQQTESVASRHSRWKARLQQSLMAWSHPHLPWVKLFPRITLRAKSTSTSFAAFDETIQKELMASWSESFRSVFYLLRSGHCPYFYLLAHQYTVLFRAGGVGGVEHIHALFSPTTKGLREALRDEGIEFSMPLTKLNEPQKTDLDVEFREYRQPSAIEGDNTEVANACKAEVSGVGTGEGKEVDGEEDEEEELGISQDDAGASSWLQSMGLDKQSFPTLEPSKVNFQRDQLMRVDNRPESIVLIQASDTQALYNFLLNTKTTVATTGATAGIPPTLLAPVAFQGATLGSFKWRPSVMKQAVDGKLQESYSLEVGGPLLPHNIFRLCCLLRESQEADFSGNFSSHEPTLTFSQILAGDGLSGVAESEKEEVSGRTLTFSQILAGDGPSGVAESEKEEVSGRPLTFSQILAGDGLSGMAESEKEEASGRPPERESLSDFLAAPDKGRKVGILKELMYSDGLYTW